MPIPGINKYAKYLGDFSRINSPAKVPERFFNRALGRSGGKIIGAAKSRFGLLGLVAVAQFFDAWKKALAVHAAEPVWAGSMMNYAMWVDRGWTHPSSGKEVPATRFFTDALKQASDEVSAFGGGFAAPRLAGSGAGIETRVRTGIYEGQKFLGDFGQFYKDSSLSGIGGRYIRRETGRQVSGFMFGALKEKRNPVEVYMQAVIKHAKKNLRGHERSGMLIASLALGATEVDFIQNSVDQAMKAGRARGLSDEAIHRKLGGTMSASGYFTADLLGPGFAERAGTEMPK